MRIKRFLALTAACVHFSCARAPAVVEHPAPTPPAALLAPEVDLTGNWATGSGPEPAVETIRLHPECTHHPAVWILKQSGNVVEAWAFAESYDQGIAVKGPGPARVAASTGRISGLDISIDGVDRYSLRYDVESKHLRGTRNGRPFWAARQVVVRTQLCPGVP